MSKAGCPIVSFTICDNAVMERFYNTFKHEYFNIHQFKNNNDLDQGVYDFIYIKYNYIRPHRYNNGLTLYIHVVQQKD